MQVADREFTSDERMTKDLRTPTKFFEGRNRSPEVIYPD